MEYFDKKLGTASKAVRDKFRIQDKELDLNKSNLKNVTKEDML